MSHMNRLKTRIFYVVALIVVLVAGNAGIAILGSSAQPGLTGRISINPYGVALNGGAELVMSGTEAPIMLPANESVPNMAFGYVIPNDYAPNSTMILEVLWETADTDCNMLFGSNFMYRAGEGQSHDNGSPAAGFRPAGASTSNEIDDFVMIVAAPEESMETGMLRFEIRPTPGEFDSLLAGDAVNLSFGRLDRESDDSCDGDVGISGLSVVYQID